MRKSLQVILNLRWLLMAFTFTALMCSMRFTPAAKAEGPLFYGQLIYTFYYQDDTYTGIHTQCTYNTCNGDEVCDGEKTPYGVEQVWRATISCDGFLPLN